MEFNLQNFGILKKCSYVTIGDKSNMDLGDILNWPTFESNLIEILKIL